MSAPSDHIGSAQSARVEPTSHGGPRRCRCRRGIAQQSTPVEEMAATAYTRASPARTLTTDVAWRASKRGAQVAPTSTGAPPARGGSSTFPRSASSHSSRLGPRVSPGRIRFGHELLELEQDDDGVSVRIREYASGREYRVRSRYVLGADGGRAVPRLIGVEYEGLGVITQTATLHVSADFSARCARSRRVDPLDLLAPGRSARSDGPDGPRPLGIIVGGVGYPPQLPGRRSASQSDEQVEFDVRQAWDRRPADEGPQDHSVVGRSRHRVLIPAGRVFLLGDAAHRHPPTGGLGLTTANHAAQNLCWKTRRCCEATHHRRCSTPTGRPSADPSTPATANDRWRTRSTTSRSWRRSGTVSRQQCRGGTWPHCHACWRGGGVPRPCAPVRCPPRHRRAVDGVLPVQRRYGYAYDSSAVVDDGTPGRRLSTTSACTSHRLVPVRHLPHAWIDEWATGTGAPCATLVATSRAVPPQSRERTARRGPIGREGAGGRP